MKNTSLFLIYLLLIIVSVSLHAQPVNSWVTTGDQSKLFQQQPVINFTNGTSTSGTILSVDTNTSYQSIDGFGFTLTQGSAEVINSLSAATQQTILDELFNESTGIGISVLRISIGASDLSNSSYSYNDLASGTDVNMEKFSLAGPDLTHLIPLLKKILLINPQIKILATPWSAPRWMKTKNSWVGGSLNTAYYGAYATYFVKYFDAMKAHGIAIWGVTPQNEPEHPGNEPSMLMNSVEQINFINNHLGPALKNAGYTAKIIAFDHNCDNTNYPIDVCNNSTYVDGAAFHLYAGSISALSTVHDATGKNIYFTEQYTGSGSGFSGTLSWHMNNVMIGSTTNWSKMALEWNLATNTSYGPRTPGGCTTCLGGITINDSTSYSRNISYYIVAQMSKLIRPGAKRIASSSTNSNLANVAFKNADGSIVLVVMNNGSARTFNVNFEGQSFSYTLPGGSVTSILWSAVTSSPLVISTPNQSISTVINTPLTIPVTISGGTASKVEFYNGPTLIETDESVPYSLAWTPATEGNYTITSKVYDTNGQYSSSLIISVRVIEYKPIPGTIQSETFDNMSGVQIETCSDVGGGLNVGYLNTNDFMEYYVDVQISGDYKVDFRVAGGTLTGGSFELRSGNTVIGTMNVPSTGGYQAWETISDTFYLSEGKQTIRLRVTAPGWNINYKVFTPAEPTGISHENSREENLFVYPNPHSRFIHVNVNLKASEKVEVILLNMLGEALKPTEYETTMEYNAAGQIKGMKIDTEGLQKGFYFLRVQLNENTVVRKILKN